MLQSGVDALYFTHPEHGTPAGHNPSAVRGPTQNNAEDGITSGWKLKPWIVRAELVVAPQSFMLSTPPRGSQLSLKNRLACTVTGVGVVRSNAIAWKWPVTP